MRFFFSFLFIFHGQIQKEHRVAIVYLSIYFCNQCDASNDTHVQETSLLKGASKESTYKRTNQRMNERTKKIKRPHKNPNLNKTVRVARIRNKQEVIQKYRVRACACVIATIHKRI